MFSISFCIKYKQNPLDPSTPLGYYLSYLLDDDTNVINETTLDIDSRKKVFVTYNEYWGNLDGVSGADTKCNEDPVKPSSSIYKAMIVLADTRIACNTSNCLGGGTGEHLDWVFEPETSYYRLDGMYVFTTNSVGIVTFSENPLSDSPYTLWTGLKNGWLLSLTCGSWNMNYSYDSGSIGDVNTIILNSSDYCNNTYYLLCVEQ